MLCIDVALHERAFLHVNERPVRYLRPGRYWLLGESLFRPFAKLTILRVNTDSLRAALKPEQRALVPDEDLHTIRLEPHQRALVLHRGKPVMWLGAGEHQIWTVERVTRRKQNGSRTVQRAVEVQLIDTSAVEAIALRDEVAALVPAADYTEVTASEGTVVLRYVDGAIEAVLPAGRHAAWTTTRKVALMPVDLRERLLHVTGQEVMTKDRVTLRLNLSASFRVADPRRLATVARKADEVLYLAMQLAAREAVATRTLDQLLAERQALAGGMANGVSERAGAVGLEVLEFGLKDVVLPGEMKTLLNRVTEAQKEAEANVILRREETASTRALAQTARVLAENPLLVRLKELEAYKDLAAQVGQVHIVLGEGSIPSLQLKAQ